MRTKRYVVGAITLFAFSVALGIPLTAQQNDTEKTQAIEPAAMEALNKMGAYLRSLKDFQVRANITNEDVLDDGQKVQFAHSTNIVAHMPNKLLAETNGDLSEPIYLYDGKSFTLFAQRMGFYATVPAPPTTAELVQVVRDKYGIEIPLVDLFLWGGPHETTNEITSAEDFGPAEVAGITCQHYLFREPGLDWQIWIQLGDHPLPRKLVLTTMTDEARPQHTSVFDWNLAPSYNEATFVFNPPPDARRIVFATNNQSSDGKQ
jgi:hypothetical protein